VPQVNRWINIYWWICIRPVVDQVRRRGPGQYIILEGECGPRAACLTWPLLWAMSVLKVQWRSQNVEVWTYGTLLSTVSLGTKDSQRGSWAEPPLRYDSKAFRSPPSLQPTNHFPRNITHSIDLQMYNFTPVQSLPKKFEFLQFLQMSAAYWAGFRRLCYHRGTYPPHAHQCLHQCKS